MSIPNNNLRADRWRDYLRAGGLTREELGHRFLEAYTAGFKRAEIADLAGVGVGYVSSLVSLVRDKSPQERGD